MVELDRISNENYFQIDIKLEVGFLITIDKCGE